MKKTLTMVLAFALVFALGVGGTLAWLTASATPVVNTFSPSNINITLTETLPENKTAQMVPGHTIEKNPKASVVAESEESFLFIKIEKSANYDNFMEFTVDSAWKPVEGHPGYYYMDATTIEMGKEYSILANDTVTVKDTVTKEMMTAEDFTQPTLTFKAAAVQYYKTNNTPFTLAEAWDNLPAEFKA
ncbi:MAG: hypothetical protein IJN37_07225 [Clostridia bacterium]|nr:hypothetical protein [Clostridia bacterium]